MGAWGERRPGYHGKTQASGQRPNLGDPRAPAAQALPPQGRGSWMTCLISQLTPSFRAKPPRNEICGRKRSSQPGLREPAGHRPAPDRACRPASEQAGPSQGTPHLEPGRQSGQVSQGRGSVRREGSRWGQTHGVQLPLEYDEGHETNDDKNRAEAQVGKEVAREITCGRRRDRMRTGPSHWKRGQRPTGHGGSEPERRSQRAWSTQPGGLGAKDLRLATKARHQEFRAGAFSWGRGTRL